MKTAGILLAAGWSRRFGAGDKLLAPLAGKPLVSHPARALRGLAPDILIAVTSSARVAAELDGFQIVTPDGARTAQSASLRAGIARASDLGAERALVVLGDMPMVGTALMGRILARCTAISPSAACDGDCLKPPVCWPRSCFPALLALQGDAGARTLLRGLPLERLEYATVGELRDIDTTQDLIDLRAATEGPAS